MLYPNLIVAAGLESGHAERSAGLATIPGPGRNQYDHPPTSIVINSVISEARP